MINLQGIDTAGFISVMELCRWQRQTVVTEIVWPWMKRGGLGQSLGKVDVMCTCVLSAGASKMPDSCQRISWENTTMEQKKKKESDEAGGSGGGT